MEVVGDIDAAKKLIAKDEDSRTENLSESENEQDQQEVSSSSLWLLKHIKIIFSLQWPCVCLIDVYTTL